MIGMLTMDLQALCDTWLMFQREHRCSIDRMLCSNLLRAEFIADAKRIVGEVSDDELLWALIGLRKKKILPSRSK